MKAKVITFLFLLVVIVVFSQPANDTFRILFYNCENFFDTYDDPTTYDDEFTPRGSKHWTYTRYLDKRNKLAKVILATGYGKAPEIIGLAEVENKAVLGDLVDNTPLKPFHYQIIHFESGYYRGVDVAILYRPDFFFPDTFYSIKVKFPANLPGKSTRDILYVRGHTRWNSKLHLFLVHAPSRLGGKQRTDPLRIFVLSIVKRKVDSIFNLEPQANIVIMGDFNDYPTDKSLLEGLKAHISYKQIVDTQLYNLSYEAFKEGKFTYVSRYDQGILDQIIVSGALMNGQSGLKVSVRDYKIYSSPFLLRYNDKLLSYEPYRTYKGYSYIGGYSDHLPVYIVVHRVRDSSE